MNTYRIAPDEYLRGCGVAGEIGEYAARLGGRALIAGGETALAAVRDALCPSLRHSGVEYAVSQFSGFCSWNNIERYRQELISGRYDLIIGVGGGRVMDCVKAASNAAGVPMIAVPTVAATCAAWTPLSVIYTDDGVYESILEHARAPSLVVVDFEVLAGAPARFLAAGIADSLAKWLEITLNTASMPRLDLTVTASIRLSEICNDILYGKGKAALEAAGAHTVTDDFIQVAEAVIFLIGTISGLSGEAVRLAIGHTIYNCFSHFRSADGFLHGQKVAFGLAVQQVLQGKPMAEVIRFLEFTKSIGVPARLEDFGLSDPAERDRLCDLIAASETLINAPLDGSRANIEKAIATVERLAG